MKYKDISGQKFGRLTALYRLKNYHKKGTYWLCVCECGNIRECFIGNLRSGKLNSCGCLKKSKHVKHGKSNSRLYNIWRSMKSRCYNSKVKEYKYYGGHGITVCDEWKNDFQAFYDWSIITEYNDGLSIDRIDINGNYEPENCRWITMKQQQRNKHTNHNITINGVTKCLSEWCETLGLKYATIRMRLHNGWNVEKALELEE